MLVVHGVYDVGECLVRVEEAMPASEDIALKPAFKRVFAEHLHDTAVGSDVCSISVLRFNRGHPGLEACLVDILELIRRILIWAKQTKAAHVTPHYVPQKLAESFCR